MIAYLLYCLLSGSQTATEASMVHAIWPGYHFLIGTHFFNQSLKPVNLLELWMLCCPLAPMSWIRSYGTFQVLSTCVRQGGSALLLKCPSVRSHCLWSILKARTDTTHSHLSRKKKRVLLTGAARCREVVQSPCLPTLVTQDHTEWF